MGDKVFVKYESRRSSTGRHSVTGEILDITETEEEGHSLIIIKDLSRGRQQPRRKLRVVTDPENTTNSGKTIPQVSSVAGTGGVTLGALLELCEMEEYQRKRKERIKNKEWK